MKLENCTLQLRILFTTGAAWSLGASDGQVGHGQTTGGSSGQPQTGQGHHERGTDDIRVNDRRGF